MNRSGQGKWMDKLFYKKLNNFELSPEVHVWEKIAKKLDESQRRPILFGSWWTILLSIVLLLLVTGAGAFMLYKKYNQQKLEKNQNKDLPYINQAHYEDLAVKLNEVESKSNSSYPNQSITQNFQSKNKNAITPSFNNEIAKEIPNRNDEKAFISESSSTLSSSSAIAAQEISDFTNQLKANDLIVSSDKEFFPAVNIDHKQFAYNYLPLKESFLKKEKDLHATLRLVDGCNVYRNTNSHFFLDVYYAPEIANRTLKTNNPALQSYVEKRANSEKPILSYSAGLKASFVFSNGFSIRGGLSYSNNSERFDYIKETQKITKEIKDQNGNVTSTQVTYVVIMDKIYNNYKFVDIPILLGYERDLKDFILSFNGGIGINVSTSQSGKIYKDVNDTKSFYLLETNGEANSQLFRSNAGVSLIGSVGLNYKYNERMMLLFEPSARYYVHSLSDPSNPVSQNYLFFGMNVGVRYRIR